MRDNKPQPIAPDALPDVILRYLAGHRTHNTPAAISAFTTDATVIDDGTTYHGAAEIETWLTRSASEFTYTIELTAAHISASARRNSIDHLVAGSAAAGFRREQRWRYAGLARRPLPHDHPPVVWCGNFLIGG